MCETFYLVHALWYEFALTVDACERAVSGHLLQSIRNIARRRRATIGWLRTWRRSKRDTNSLCTFIIWTEWSQVDEGVWLKSKSDLSHQPKWKVISEEEQIPIFLKKIMKKNLSMNCAQWGQECAFKKVNGVNFVLDYCQGCNSKPLSATHLWVPACSFYLQHRSLCCPSSRDLAIGPCWRQSSESTRTFDAFIL